jgi:hypothetical protein
MGPRPIQVDEKRGTYNLVLSASLPLPDGRGSETRSEPRPSGGGNAKDGVIESGMLIAPVGFSTEWYRQRSFQSPLRQPSH